MIDSIRAGRAIAAPRRSSVAPGLAAAAAAAFAFLSVQYVALRRDAAPHVIRSYSLLMAGTRGNANQTVIENPDRPFSLFIDIPPQPSYPQYKIEIVDSSGRP